MARNYLQGKFIPKRPDKYVGDPTNIFFRSSWERKCMIRFDTDPSILKWGSEEVVVPYVNQVDNRKHRYFPDFVIQYKTKLGEVKHAMIEVKPKAQTRPPALPKTGKQTKRYLNEMVTYLTNDSKWKYARAWCQTNGWDFVILTEDELKV
jgi:hypothetical protein